MPRLLPAPGAPFVLAALLALAPTPGIAAQGAAPSNAGGVTVSGTVYDSLAGRPLAEALIQIVNRRNGAKALSATSDAHGDFEITAVPPGSYIIGFFHPALDSLGLGVPPKAVDVASDAPTHVALFIPSASRVHDLLCAPDATADSTGLLLGFVRDADTGVPLAGANVVVMWRELVIDKGIHTERREVPTKANEAGWFALCGVPTDGPLTARAELGSDVTGFLEIAIPPRGLLHRDFYIPRGSSATIVAANDSATGAAGATVRRGSARLTGTVRDDRGRPLSGAQLLVWGSGVTGSTSEDGTFALGNLPAGSQALEVRYVGYAPRRVTVDLVSNATRSVTVTLDERADVLNEVVVYGKRTKRSRDFTGFVQRSKAGFGHFLTRADIAKRHPFQFTDLFRMIPGFRVVPVTDGFGYRIVSTRGTGFGGQCQPDIYIDGMQIYDAGSIDAYVMPNDVAAVEAYAGPSGAPLQYTHGTCGSILIWTGADIGGNEE